MGNWKKATLIVLTIVLSLGIGVSSFIYSMLLVDMDSPLFGRPGGLYFVSMALGWSVFWFSITLMGKTIVEITDGTLNIKHQVYTWPEKVDLKEMNRINVGDERVVLTRADDQIFEFIVKGNWRYAFAGFVVWAIFLAFLLNVFLSDQEVEEGNAFFTPLFFAGFVFMLMNAFKELRYSFDRFAGKIHVRVNGLSFSTPFDKVIPFNHWDRMYLKHKYFRFPFRVYGERGAMQWSFYVQYMDKNQTLSTRNGF